MNIVLLAHPEFLGLRSQDQFARMLHDEYLRRGHRVALRRPRAIVRARVSRGPLAKWAGYVDQYLLWPPRLRASLRDDPPDTLYVFCDQALGPWIPLAAHRPHVVHCHDLLALRSALGELPENPTSWTGRLYQRWIRAGFRRARHAISISERTRSDLHAFGGIPAGLSEVVHNGLGQPLRPLDPALARLRLADAGIAADKRGCLLHVGGGQWYKNDVGVIHLYAQHVRDSLADGRAPMPLWMVAPPPRPALEALISRLPRGANVRFLRGLSTDSLEAVYSHARALLFPSLAEGFGWPVLEALACGCPVLTTNEAPMTEVGADVVDYLPRLAFGEDVQAWAARGAPVLARILRRDPEERRRRAAAGVARAAIFSADAAIDAYLTVYRRVLERELPALAGAPVHDRHRVA